MMVLLLMSQLALAVDCERISVQDTHDGAERVGDQVGVTHVYPTWQWPNVYSSTRPTFLVRVDAEVDPITIVNDIQVSIWGTGPVGPNGQRKGREQWHKRAFNLRRCLFEVEDGVVRYTTVMFESERELGSDTGITWYLPKVFVGHNPGTTTVNRHAGGQFRTGGERQVGSFQPYSISGPLAAGRSAQDLLHEIMQGLEALEMLEKWADQPISDALRTELEKRRLEAEIAVKRRPTGDAER